MKYFLIASMGLACLCSPVRAAEADAPETASEEPSLLELFRERNEQRRKPYKRYRFNDAINVHRTKDSVQRKSPDLGDVDDPRWQVPDRSGTFEDDILPVMPELPEGVEFPEDEGTQRDGNWFTPSAFEEGPGSWFEEDPAEDPGRPRDVGDEMVEIIERRRLLESRLEYYQELGLSREEAEARLEAEGFTSASDEENAEELTAEEMEALLEMAAEQAHARRDQEKDAKEAERETEPGGVVTYEPPEENNPEWDSTTIELASDDLSAMADLPPAVERMGSDYLPESAETASPVLSRTEESLAASIERSHAYRNSLDAALEREIAGNSIAELTRQTMERYGSNASAATPDVSDPRLPDDVVSRYSGFSVTPAEGPSVVQFRTVGGSVFSPGEWPSGDLPGSGGPLGSAALPTTSLESSSGFTAPTVPEGAGVVADPKLRFNGPDRNLGILPSGQRDPLRF